MTNINRLLEAHHGNRWEGPLLLDALCSRFSALRFFLFSRLMTQTKPEPASLSPAVLLVLLPATVSVAERVGRAAVLTGLSRLQRQLGEAIQVMRVDEEFYPAVVHSFAGGKLPAFVLTWHGSELWRAQGLPDSEGIADLLLSKLHAADAGSGLLATMPGPKL